MRLIAAAWCNPFRIDVHGGSQRAEHPSRHREGGGHADAHQQGCRAVTLHRAADDQG
jgi:hypothetical protein